MLGVNIGLAASIGLLNPLLLQIDFALFGSLGVGSLKANFEAQLSAVLKATFDIGIGISNPLAGFFAALSGVIALQAQIQAALALAVPAVSVEAGLQLSANAKMAAALTAQIGGLELLIQGALSVKAPAVSFLAGLDLSVGPLIVASWENITMAQAGNNLQTDMNAGMTFGPASIGPGELTYGVMIVTKSPSAWATLKATLMA